ncbi:MAG: hypothetical protein LEGION0398_MBIBDBAK_01226 [Legionellaceae bacterium]
MFSALLINDVPIECINQASIAYHIPAHILISVLKVEGGRVGLAKKNSNGTYDYGPMQINSIWLPVLSIHGYTKEKLLYDPCANMWVGTWILSQKMTESTNLWRGVANYHSHTQEKNAAYQYKVWNVYQLINQYLNSENKQLLMPTDNKSVKRK